MEHRIFRAMKITLFDAIIVATCHYAFNQTYIRYMKSY